jgi:pyruvate-ferredoxin/flavodoxin oxidoreductase
MDVPMTFADFAVTVPALQHHFQLVPPENWSDTMVPVSEHLDLDADEREENQPFIWATDYEGRLQRLRVSRAIVEACEERRQYWRLLRALTRKDIVPVDEEAIAERARAEVVEKVWQNLLELAQSGEPMPEAIAERARAEVVEKVWQNLLELAQSGEPMPAALMQLAAPGGPGSAPDDSKANA